MVIQVGVAYRKHSSMHVVCFYHHVAYYAQRSSMQGQTLNISKILNIVNNFELWLSQRNFYLEIGYVNFLIHYLYTSINDSKYCKFALKWNITFQSICQCSIWKQLLYEVPSWIFSQIKYYVVFLDIVRGIYRKRGHIFLQKKVWRTCEKVQEALAVLIWDNF